jgi:hypothetical protein
MHNVMSGGSLAGTTTANSFNVASVTDTGVGQFTITVTRAFNTAVWCCQVTVERVSNANLNAANLRFAAVRQAGQAAGSILVECWDGTATTANAVDPQSWHVSGIGVQV